jgi:four helix bundle protein
MTYQRFEDLPVWQKAADLYESVETLLGVSIFAASGSFRNQLDRAALSVSNNIAEGFERGTTNELLQFIYIARGSAGEVRSMLVLKQRRSTTPAQGDRLKNTIEIAESCSRQLRAWAEALQNSDIKGQRHLNDKSRAQYDQKQRAAAFQKKLLESLPANHPLRTAAKGPDQGQ